MSWYGGSVVFRGTLVPFHDVTRHVGSSFSSSTMVPLHPPWHDGSSFSSRTMVPFHDVTWHGGSSFS